MRFSDILIMASVCMLIFFAGYSAIIGITHKQTQAEFTSSRPMLPINKPKPEPESAPEKAPTPKADEGKPTSTEVIAKNADKDNDTKPTAPTANNTPQKKAAVFNVVEEEEAAE